MKFVSRICIFLPGMACAVSFAAAAAVLFLALSMSLTGCAGPPVRDTSASTSAGINTKEDDTRLFLYVGIDPENMAIYSGRKTEGDPPPPANVGPTIRWDLLSADGLPVESGIAADPRWFFAESFGPDGRIHGGLMKKESGLLGLTLPAVAGVIRFTEMDGTEIGRVAYDPAQWLGSEP